MAEAHKLRVRARVSRYIGDDAYGAGDVYWVDRERAEKYAELGAFEILGEPPAVVHEREEEEAETAGSMEEDTSTGEDTEPAIESEPEPDEEPEMDAAEGEEPESLTRKRGRPPVNKMRERPEDK